jgi:hypothetical protein
MWTLERKIKECVDFTAKWRPRVRLSEGWEKRVSEDDIEALVAVDPPRNDIEFLSDESDFCSQNEPHR